MSTSQTMHVGRVAVTSAIGVVINYVTEHCINIFNEVHLLICFMCASSLDTQAPLYLHCSISTKISCASLCSTKCNFIRNIYNA